jgi:hypothetical protein
MVKFDPQLHLPTSDELPCSDDTPVDNAHTKLVRKGYFSNLK